MPNSGHLRNSRAGMDNNTSSSNSSSSNNNTTTTTGNNGHAAEVSVVTTTSTHQGYFQCGECKQSYARADHLARHVRCHTQEKPFQCSLCPKKYSRADLLKRHALCHDESATQEGRKRQKRQKSPSQFGRVSQACRACAAAKLKCVEEKPCERCVQKNIICTVERRASNQPIWANKNVQQQQNSPPDGTGNVNPQPVHQQPRSGSIQSSNHSHAVHDSEEDEYSMVALEHVAAENLQQMSNQIPSGMYLDTVMADMVTSNGGMMNTGSAGNVINTTLMNQNDGIVTHMPTPQSPDNNIDFRLTEPDQNAQFNLDSGDFFRDLLLSQRPLQGNSWARDINFGVEDDMQLTDFDFGLLNTYSEVFQSGDMEPLAKSLPMHMHHQNGSTNFSFEPLVSNHQRNDTPDLQYAKEETAQITRGIDAFKKSLWRFNPVRNLDRYGNEQQNLAVNVPNDQLSPDVAKVVAKMDRGSRDRLLCMVLDSCDGAMRDRVVGGFPSSQMLHSLVNIYFDMAKRRVTQFIHPGTFVPGKCYPPLLACVIAGGAVCTSLSTVRKLGFALQEAGRIAIPKSFERDNTQTRDLQVLQAFALQLEIGLWSGNKRKMEISESHGQPVLNMLRRAGRFRRSAYKLIEPTIDDSEEELDQKWREWVKQESFKRLVFHLMIYDRQVSMAMFINPVSSYAEFALPFPSYSELWFASDAQEWSRIYLSSPLPPPSSPDRSISFLDCIRSFPNLIHPEPTVDLKLAHYVNLHGIWGLVWEYRQLSSVLKGNHVSNSTPSQYGEEAAGLLLLTSRYQELCQSLQNYRIAFDTGDTESRLMLELISMMLHVSIEDLQAYAGKEGGDEALRVAPILQQWSRSRESRQAVAFAGQLVKIARESEKGRLRAFNAIAVYHASLTLWTYGILKMENRHTNNHHNNNTSNQSHNINHRHSVSTLSNTSASNTISEPQIYLDAAHQADIQRWVTTGQGSPGIMGLKGRWTSLETPGQVMKVVIDVLKENSAGDVNNPEDEESVPPLVENLMSLMLDLANVTAPGSH